MFIKKKVHEPTPLDEAIANILSEMQGVNADDKEYAAMADQLVKLMKLKKEIEPSWHVSPDVLIAAGANILGILLILNYEKLGIVTSKALSFVAKLK